MKHRLQKILTLLLVTAAGCFSAYAHDVKGTVVSATDGEPLIGATVLVKGNAAKSSVTDVDGGFSLSGIPADAKLEVSYVGFSSKEVSVKGQSTLKVELTEDSEVLNEVVVIGYGTMDKKELTSAISHVSEKDFLKASSVDPSMMIQGKVPGVSITNTGVGDPNNQASIQIRGVSSRAAGLGPLIVIDGVAGGNLTNINPNDIASFDILKDGAASAIYGTRGSNGVILVTTKKGARDGAVHTTYTGNVSANVATHDLKMLDADMYRVYRADQYNGNDLGGNDDWLGAVTRTGWSTQHTLTINGGSERTNYRATVDFKNADGIDKYSNRQEYGARASINHTTKGGLFTFNVNIAPRLINRKIASWDVFRNALEINPTTPIMDEENPGRYTAIIGQAAGYNPVELINLEKNKAETKLLDWDGTVKLNLLPLFFKDGKDWGNSTLSTQVTFAGHESSNFNYWFRPSTSTQAIANGYDGEASRSYNKSSQQILEWLANYSGRFGDHNVRLMLGYSYQYIKNSGVNADNKDFANDGLGADNLGNGQWAVEEGNIGMGSYMNDSKLIAFFGRVSYDYKGKYLMTASLRHEGSSKFGKNNKWGNFPAVSLGWRISQEHFMEGASGWLNDLKIRGDYGETGNQDFDSYRSLATMTGFGYVYYQGKWIQVWGPARNVNANLKWEKAKNWNVGIDFSLFDNKLVGSINYYSRRQQDLLGDYNVPVPPYLHGTTFVNVGTMKNSGVEIDLTYNAIRTKDWDLSFNFIGATCDNKFVSFSNGQYVGQDYYDVCGTSDPYPMHTLQRIQAGHRIGNFYMYKYAGIDKDGNFVVYDKKGNMIPASEATDDDKRIVGNGLPKFNASLTGNLRWRNWDLSVFFRGAFGFDIFNTQDFYYGTQGFTGNVLQKAYTKNKDIKGQQVVSDYYLEKGDYVKLDMVSLGYTWKVNARFLDELRVDFTARNLATFTRYSGIDPASVQVNGLEPGATGSRTYYPSCRQFLLGLRLSF